MEPEKDKEDKIQINIITPRDSNWLDRVFSEEKTQKHSKNWIPVLVVGLVFLAAGLGFFFFKHKSSVPPAQNTASTSSKVPTSGEQSHFTPVSPKNLVKSGQPGNQSKLTALEQKKQKKLSAQLKLALARRSAEKKAREERIKKEQQLALLIEKQKALKKYKSLKKLEALKKLEEAKIQKEKELAFLQREKEKALLRKEQQLKQEEAAQAKEQQLKQEEAAQAKEQQLKQALARKKTLQQQAPPIETNPVIVSSCSPEYPQFERNEGIQGTVILLVVVGRNGAVQKVIVKKSSGNFDLDYAAIDSVKSCWKFAPGTQNGIPVKATLSIPIRFSL
jgi:protein TonB